MTTCKECKFCYETENYYLPQPPVSTSNGSFGFYTGTTKFNKCRRYPESVIVQDDYWCGEFVGKADELEANIPVQKDASSFFSDLTGEEMQITAKVLLGEATKEEWEWLSKRGIFIGNNSCGGSFKNKDNK